MSSNRSLQQRALGRLAANKDDGGTAFQGYRDCVSAQASAVAPDIGAASSLNQLLGYHSWPLEDYLAHHYYGEPGDLWVDGHAVPSETYGIDMNHSTSSYRFAQNVQGHAIPGFDINQANVLGASENILIGPTELHVGPELQNLDPATFQYVPTSHYIQGLGYNGAPDIALDTGNHAQNPEVMTQSLPSSALNFKQDQIEPSLIEALPTTATAPPTHPPYCEVCERENGDIRKYARHLAAKHGSDTQSAIAQLVYKALLVTCRIPGCKYSGRDDSLLRHLNKSAGRPKPSEQLHSSRQVLDFCQQSGWVPPVDVAPAALAKRAKDIMTAMGAADAARIWREIARYWAERGFDVAGAGWRLGQAARKEGIIPLGTSDELAKENESDIEEAESVLQGVQGHDPPSVPASHLSLSDDASAFETLAEDYDIVSQWDAMEILDGEDTITENESACPYQSS